MKLLRWIHLILVLGLLAACAPKSQPGGGGFGGFNLFATATPLPQAIPTIIHAPDAQIPMRAFLDALKADDYASMYALLAKTTRDSVSQEDFTKRYTEALNNMSAASLDYEVISQLLSPYTAQVGFRVTYHTALVGDIQRDMVARFTLDKGEWRLLWDSSLILPELAGGYELKMDYQIPARGNIYDRNGLPIAAQSDTLALGVIPGQMTGKSEGFLISELAKLCGRTSDSIRNALANAGADWYVAMCEASREETLNVLDLNLPGLVVTPYNTRYYFAQGIAPEVVGYTQLIPKEELDAYRRGGYRGDEKVGRVGIEKSAEDYLAGKHGGSLYAVTSTGQIVTRIASSDPQPADSIYITLDRNLQFYAQKALRGFKGAIVVLERDTGRVLAMASSPDYDPNLFDPNNTNSGYLLNDLLNDTDQPLLNRAAQGQYPLGSVFKIITMSAGMESGLYLPETTYDCQYDFNELLPYGGPVLYDWTYQHCQDRLHAGLFCDTSDSTPSGLLTLPQGLMRSCDPYFWHIGLDLWKNDRSSDIAKMSRAFGLGAATGIDQIAEAAGNIEDPGTDPIDATNQAIGQGKVLVTPLQVARFIAAVGNGGTLYRPQLVEKIQPVEGNPITAFKPEASGTLPLRPDNLAVIQQAMYDVVHNPRGTANFRLRGLLFPVAGKTGSAESGNGESHAWFGGYTLANELDTTKPNIAIVVLLENQGEGSDWAAPLFRAMVETYYYGSPQATPWFGPIGNLYTPTPLGGIPTRTPKK